MGCRGLPAPCYIPHVRELVRNNPRFFFWTALAGLALRLIFLFLNPQVTDDSRIYADIANNWLVHGIYGVTDAARIVPTYIRLPGYPAFLAVVFAIFGKDNFRAVLLIQVLIDLGTCFLIGDLAWRTALATGPDSHDKTAGVARIAILLSAVCPFFANYAAAALTETLEIFFTVLALDFAVIGLNGIFGDSGRRFHVRPWAACGLSIAAAILLRPDGGILLIAIDAYLAFLLTRSLWERLRHRQDSPLVPGRFFYAAVLLTLVALAPLIPWTVRNLHTLHRFQPLSPRYANNPGDYVPVGFNRWVKTWIADYVSVQEVYWQVPGEEIDFSKLPSRALDTVDQEQRTREILNRYNERKDIDQDLDRQFAGLAEQRIQSAPLRYYVWLPLVRIADMWLRPRTELTQADPRWWEFNDDLKYSVLSVAFGLINLLYVGLARAGLRRQYLTRWAALLIFFIVLRSAFLGTLENPETRYTLECYPVLIVLATEGLRFLHVFDFKSEYVNP